MDVLEGYRVDRVQEMRSSVPAEGYVKEFTRHSNDVLLNLNELRHRNILTDTTLVVGSVRLQAHCAVLVACRLVQRPKHCHKIVLLQFFNLGLWAFPLIGAAVFPPLFLTCLLFKTLHVIHKSSNISVSPPPLLAVGSSTRCTPTACCFRGVAAAGSSSRPCLSPTRWTHPASPCCLTSCTLPASLWHQASSLGCSLPQHTCRWTTWLKPAGTSCSCTGEGTSAVTPGLILWMRLVLLCSLVCDLFSCFFLFFSREKLSSRQSQLELDSTVSVAPVTPKGGDLPYPGPQRLLAAAVATRSGLYVEPKWLNELNLAQSFHLSYVLLLRFKCIFLPWGLAHYNTSFLSFAGSQRRSEALSSQGLSQSASPGQRHHRESLSRPKWLLRLHLQTAPPAPAANQTLQQNPTPATKALWWVQRWFECMLLISNRRGHKCESVGHMSPLGSCQLTGAFFLQSDAKTSVDPKACNWKKYKYIVLNPLCAAATMKEEETEETHTSPTALTEAWSGEVPGQIDR